MVVPYSKGHTESFKTICNKVGVQVHFKGGNTIKDQLVGSKDKDNITNKGGVIYRYKCHHLGFTVGSIGKTGRTFGDMYKDHLGAPSPIYVHAKTMGHSIHLDNISIIDRGSQGAIRTIRTPCSSESITLPSTGTFASTNWHTVGMRCYMTCQLSIYSNTPTSSFFPPTSPLYPTSPYWCQIFLPYFCTKNW